jgi:hypothetical protein
MFFYLASSYFHFLDFFSLDSTHGPTVQQCENTSQLTFPISIYSVGRKEFHLGCSRPSRGASFGSKELLLTPPPPFFYAKIVCAYSMRRQLSLFTEIFGLYTVTQTKLINYKKSSIPQTGSKFAYVCICS